MRNSRKLEFNKKGKYEEVANRQRARAKLDKLQLEIAQIAKKTGIAVENKVTIIQPKKFFVCRSSVNVVQSDKPLLFLSFQSENTVPDIEWWDSVILQQNK